MDSIKRDISHLCRDASPPKETIPPPEDVKPDINSRPPPQNHNRSHTQPGRQSSSSSQLPPQLYSDPNFPPSWPLLPDTSNNTGATFVDGTIGNGMGVKGNGTGNENGMGWGTNDESELGALSYVYHKRAWN